MKIIQEYTTTISLESQLERLSLEAISTANVMETFKSIIPNLISKIKTSLSEYDDAEVPKIVSEITSEAKELDKKLKYATLAQYNKLLVSVPEGFRGLLVDYVKMLDGQALGIYGEANKSLVEFKFLLSAFITNKDNKITLKDETGLYKQLDQHRQSTLKEIAVYYPEGDSRSRAYLSDVIRRLGDMDTLFLSVVSLQKKHYEQNMKAINKSVTECVELLDIVLKTLSDRSVTNISGAASMNISEGAFHIAQYIEFVAVYRFRTMQALETTSKLFKQLNLLLG